jgi:hypothetical protein
MNAIIRRCKSCKEDKPITDFRLAKGYRVWACRLCCKEQSHQYYLDNKVTMNAKSIAWQKRNLEHSSTKAWERSQKNRIRHNKSRRRQFSNHLLRDGIEVKKCVVCELEKPLTEFHIQKKYKRDGRDNRCKSCVKISQAPYVSWRRKNDLNFRIYCRLSTSLRDCLKAVSARKFSKTTDILGCSISDFKLYIESKFEVGMDWDNYGKIWHLDHIIPRALFDLLKQDQVRACFHFSNYQPMFVTENISKSDKLPDGRRARIVRKEFSS